MKKPDSLRAALVEAIRDGEGAKILARDPEALLMWIDQGTLAVRAGDPPSYEWRYRLSLTLTDFPSDRPDEVALVIVQWLHVHQPDLLLNHAKGNEAFRFDVDIIDEKTVDWQVELRLSEAVMVAPGQGGGLALSYPREPAISEQAIVDAIVAGVAIGPDGIPVTLVDG